MKNNFSTEEQLIFGSFQEGKLVKSKRSKHDILIAEGAAANTILKTKTVSIQLSEKEICKLKVKAVEAGVPFNSLISALVHQYIENKIFLTL